MYHSTSKKYPSPEELQDEGFRFYVHHIHSGNDPLYEWRAMFGNSKYAPVYVTTCTIKTKEGEQVGYGEAVCSDKDVPNRKRGHEIAVGRAIKDYMIKRTAHEQAQRAE
jgi:hypothetical protein